MRIRPPVVAQVLLALLALSKTSTAVAGRECSGDTPLASDFGFVSELLTNGLVSQGQAREEIYQACTAPLDKIPVTESRAFAEALVQRRAKSDVSVNARADFEVGIYVKPEIISLIIQNGLLNFHQVGKTNGHHLFRTRAKVENKISGWDGWPRYDESDQNSRKREELRVDPYYKLRPKYGFVRPRRRSELRVDSPVFDGVEMVGGAQKKYGDVVLIFRNEIASRTTFSMGDSLDLYQKTENRECDLRPRVWDVPHGEYPILALRDFDPSGRLERNCSYIEAQIWGELDLSDVLEIRIPSDRPELLETVKVVGLPVYSFKRIVSAKYQDPSEIASPENLLFAGDPATMEKYENMRRARRPAHQQACAKR
jgi:hypothetical protein